jgi:hypothetical protein
LNLQFKNKSSKIVMSREYIVFGDLVRVKLYDSPTKFSGYMTSNKIKNAIVDSNIENAMLFCVTPFGSFAEDEAMLGRSFNSTPIVLQQLTWHPGNVIGGERNVPIAEFGSVQYQSMDISNRDDTRSMVNFYDTTKPQLVHNPKYNTKYYMTLGEASEFLINNRDPFIKLSNSPRNYGYHVELEFDGSIENSSRNYPHSQAYAPYGSLEGLCNKCTKCTR